MNCNSQVQISCFMCLYNSTLLIKNLLYSYTENSTFPTPHNIPTHPTISSTQNSFLFSSDHSFYLIMFPIPIHSQYSRTRILVFNVLSYNLIKYIIHSHLTTSRKKPKSSKNYWTIHKWHVIYNIELLTHSLTTKVLIIMLIPLQSFKFSWLVTLHRSRLFISNKYVILFHKNSTIKSD